MDNALVAALAASFAWPDATASGPGVAVGQVGEGLARRLLTPEHLLDLIMRRSVRPPQVRLFRNGVELQPNLYVTMLTFKNDQVIPLVDMRKIEAILRHGGTVVLNSLELFDATLEVACRALQWWTGELVRANAYLTTQGTSGLPLHWDDHDVIILQAAGDKEWEVRGAGTRLPLQRDREGAGAPEAEVLWAGRLRCGDALHIPRGHWHRAWRTESDGLSLHVTFGIGRLTGADWLAGVTQAARASDLFRHDLIRENGPAAERQRTELISEAERALTRMDPQTFLQDHAQHPPAARFVGPVTPIGPDASVVCIAGFAPSITSGATSLTVTAGGRSLEFAAAAEPALRALLSGDPVRLADVHHDTGYDALGLALLLLEREICALVTPDLAAGYAGLVGSAER